MLQGSGNETLEDRFKKSSDVTESGTGFRNHRRLSGD